MNKIHQTEKKKPHTRKFAAILCAAALVTALTATALAAYRFIIAEEFDGYFGELTERQAEVLEELGTAELSPSTANETTLTPLAVIGDTSRCYMKFRLEAPEGTQFPATGEELKFLQIFGPTWDDHYSIVDESGKELAVSSGEIEWIDNVPGDNVLEFIIRFNSSSDHPARFNDGSSKILTIKGIWREELDKEYTKVLDGPWSFDIGFYSGLGEKELEVDGLSVRRVFNGVEYEDEGMSMTLRSMRITPLSLTYSYDFTTPDPRTIPGPGTICIVMTDGSMVEVPGGPGAWTDFTWYGEALIQTPIDLDGVDYIQFGNQQIQVN